MPTVSTLGSLDWTLYLLGGLSQTVRQQTARQLVSVCASCKCIHHTPQPIDIPFVLTLNRQCTWTLSVGRSEINPQRCHLLTGIATKLQSVDDLLKLLSVLDASRICVGNADTKFEGLASQRKGSFSDQLGKS